MKIFRPTFHTRQPALFALLAVAPLFAAGCGKPAKHAVTGTVKLNGKPVPHCKVGLFPDVAEFNPDKHGFGYGITDESGAFEVQHPQGEKGIQTGRYKVTFEAWVDSKGKPLPADAKPSEVPGGVKNLFPDIYQAPSSTPESIDVGAGGTRKEFDITATK
jgi:hypothetical protein